MTILKELLNLAPTTRAGDATEVDPNQKTVYAKGYQEYMPTELELCEAVLTRSNAELDLREKMIARIEGFFGDLQTLRYDQLSTEDLGKMYFSLLDSALIQPAKIGAKIIRREADLQV